MITPEIGVADVIHQSPSVRRIFDKHGFHGCGGEYGPTEPLLFFASVHQVDLGQLLHELNAEIARPQRWRCISMLEDYIY